MNCGDPVKRSTVRWLSLTCGVAILVAACDANSPEAVAPSGGNGSSANAAAAVSVQARASTGSRSELLGVLPPLSSDSATLYVCTADSVAHTGSGTIGALGGTIAFGNNTLIVPPGALLQKTQITATEAGDGHVSAQFQPEGLHFILPAVLTLSYRQCATAPAPSATIVYLQSLLGGLLEILPTKLDLGLKVMVAPIWHFSVYAVADRTR
jgi:hypothetical protein